MNADRKIVRKGIKFLDISSGCDLVILLDEHGNADVVKGIAFHWDVYGGPCREMEIGRFQIRIPECPTILEAEKVGVRAARNLCQAVSPDVLFDFVFRQGGAYYWFGK